jgi:hypothetical protein
MLTEKKWHIRLVLTVRKLLQVAQECLMIPKKGVPIKHSLKKDGQCNRQRKKARKVIGVWCLTPLSTIFQL